MPLPQKTSEYRTRQPLKEEPLSVDLKELRSLRFERIAQTVTRRDTMLYALGVGLGADPCDERQLRFVYEKNLVALPTMAITLAYPDFMEAYARLGLDTAHILHGHQEFELHRALPVEGTVCGVTAVTGLADKGPGKGLVVSYATVISDGVSGERLCTINSSSFCRAEGGITGAVTSSPAPPPVPSRAPDGVCDLPTLPQAALIYRLSGDYNALHVEPALARQAGFRQPILHGRCTFGVVGHALLRSCCGYDPARLEAMDARFSAPVYPGETIRTEYWHEPDRLAFRARVLERDVVVLDRGRARIRSFN